MIQVGYDDLRLMNALLSGIDTTRPEQQLSQFIYCRGMLGPPLHSSSLWLARNRSLALRSMFSLAC